MNTTSRTITIEKLKVGQRFSWIPAEWYGPARLTRKTLRNDGKYDLVYDARVVNPPGISYGVPATVKIRLLQSGRKGQQ